MCFYEEKWTISDLSLYSFCQGWSKLIMVNSFNRPAKLHHLKDNGNTLTTPTKKDTLWEDLLRLLFESIKRNFQNWLKAQFEISQFDISKSKTKSTSPIKRLVNRKRSRRLMLGELDGLVQGFLKVTWYNGGIAYCFSHSKIPVSSLSPI